MQGTVPKVIRADDLSKPLPVIVIIYPPLEPSRGEIKFNSKGTFIVRAPA